MTSLIQPSHSPGLPTPGSSALQVVSGPNSTWLVIDPLLMPGVECFEWPIGFAFRCGLASMAIGTELFEYQKARAPANAYLGKCCLYMRHRQGFQIDKVYAEGRFQPSRNIGEVLGRFEYCGLRDQLSRRCLLAPER